MSEEGGPRRNCDRPLPFIVAQRRSLWTRRRVGVWGTSLMVLSWFVYVHTMMVPGYLDRAGRFKGTDYIYFYVMGSLISEGRADALSIPTRTWPRAVARSIRC